MQGEKIGEFSGKSAMPRVLPSDDGRFVKMEITFEDKGKLLGLEVMGNATYQAWERVPGQIYGEGHGIIGTASGDSLIWNGHGVGQPTGEGMGMRFVVALAVQAGGKLESLNSMLLVGEHVTDDDGNTTSTLWEWK